MSFVNSKDDVIHFDVDYRIILHTFVHVRAIYLSKGLILFIGHNFASLTGGDLAAMQQLALQQQQQQQFYPPFGMIHPVTGGDTTTDSGSLYTTPPALCPVLSSSGHTPLRRHDGNLSAPLASPSNASSTTEEGGSGTDEEDVGVENHDNDDVTEEKSMRGRRRTERIPLGERSSVIASSASEGAHRNSVGAADDVEGCENSALLRPTVNSGGVSGRRRRPKHRRHREAHDSNQSRVDSGVSASSRAAPTKEALSGTTRAMLQPFAAQPFSNIAGSDILGEYLWR